MKPPFEHRSTNAAWELMSELCLQTIRKVAWSESLLTSRVEARSAPGSRLATVIYLLARNYSCVPCRFNMGSMMVDKTFMGRVFLPPEPSAELHINFGWNVQNGQKYPELMPLFQEAISKQDYEALMSKIKDYLEKNSINDCLPICGLMTIGCGVGCFVCGSIAHSASKITSDLTKIGGNPHKKRLG